MQCACAQCWVWQRAEHGGPSGHPCHAMFPVKCCQRGLCGLLWRLKACSTALPAQAADLRKGNLGRSNGGVAPELFTALVQCHPRYSIWELVCAVPAVMCVRELGDKCECSCECKYFYKEMQALNVCLQALVLFPYMQTHIKSHCNLKHGNETIPRL